MVGWNGHQQVKEKFAVVVRGQHLNQSKCLYGKCNLNNSLEADVELQGLFNLRQQTAVQDNINTSR